MNFLIKKTIHFVIKKKMNVLIKKNIHFVIKKKMNFLIKKNQQFFNEKKTAPLLTISILGVGQAFSALPG